MLTSNVINLQLEKSKKNKLRDCVLICIDTNVRTTMIRAGQRTDKDAAKNAERMHLDMFVVTELPSSRYLLACSSYHAVRLSRYYARHRDANVLIEH